MDTCSLLITWSKYPTPTYVQPDAADQSLSHAFVNNHMYAKRKWNNRDDFEVFHVRNRSDKAMDLPKEVRDTRVRCNNMQLVASLYRGKVYAHLKHSPIENWVISLLLLIGSIAHNIFVKCLGVIFIKLLTCMGIKFNAKLQDKCNRMWDAGTPWRSIVAIIPQFFISLAAVFTFGQRPTLGFLWGHFEREFVLNITDDHVKKFTWAKRLNLHEILIPCKQPYTVLKEDAATELIKEKLRDGRSSSKMMKVELLDICTRPFFRMIVSNNCLWDNVRKEHARFD